MLKRAVRTRSIVSLRLCRRRWCDSPSPFGGRRLGKGREPVRARRSFNLAFRHATEPSSPCRKRVARKRHPRRAFACACERNEEEHVSGVRETSEKRFRERKKKKRKKKERKRTARDVSLKGRAEWEFDKNEREENLEIGEQVSCFLGYTDVKIVLRITGFHQFRILYVILPY